MKNDHLESRVEQLERKTWYLTALCGLLLVVLTGITVRTSVTPVKAAQDSKILRVRGLIIENDQGQARILLGAPFPFVSERLRKDVNGEDLVFLDEQGHDRLSFGEMMPAYPGFHRIGSAYGLAIFDTKGDERGGMGFISNGSTVNRAVIALDRPKNPSVSTDAWGAMVDDATGFAGTAYTYAPESGHNREGITIGTKGQTAFVTFNDTNGKKRSTFSLGADGMPCFHLFDKAGVTGHDLLDLSRNSTPENH